MFLKSTIEMHFSNYLHKLRFNQENKVILNIPGIKKSIHEFGLISGLEYLGEWDRSGYPSIKEFS